ncbi:ABC transporter permease subunit [Deltaproteobacteria bacterium TL4]
MDFMEVLLSQFIYIILAEIRESLRTKWFFLYIFIFGGAVFLLLTLGVTESQVQGFTGLSRFLITYIQLCVAILPLFILMTTVRTIVGERESNVLEYFLSMPFSLSAYYWGKISARFLVVFIPVCMALLGALIWGLTQNLAIPWEQVGYYSILLGTLSWCFLGIGMLISILVRKQEWALGLAFLIWLILLLFMDIIMIGVMLQHQIEESLIVGISLLNPLQAFRTATILLFDPQLSILGPSSYVILDHLGRVGFLIFAILYPLGIGWGSAFVGYQIFKRGDLV